MFFVRIFAAFVLAMSLAACSSTSSTSSAAAPDAGGTSGGSSAPEQVASNDNDEGIQCKRVQVTGTRFTEKVCTTRAQREEQARRAAEAQQQIGIKAQQMGGPASS